MPTKPKAPPALRHVEATELAIRRQRRGKTFVYLTPRGSVLRDQRTLFRLKRLAVPPAYRHVRYAEDPRAHIQAVGDDDAGRRQYRYHPDWNEVRERRKAHHLAELAPQLPKLRAALSRHLKGNEPTREFALAAVIELISLTALRAGSESYARERGTRGASTLLKSNVVIKGPVVSLNFRGKGGKQVEKDVRSARLARILRVMTKLPGKRLFQYRKEDGGIAQVKRRDVNAFLKELTSERITLKDFRTLIACSCALGELATLDPKPSERGRRKQILATLRTVAGELTNTPAVCRKSYVHTAIVDAFEAGELARMCRRQSPRSTAARERMIGQMLERIAGNSRN